MIIVETNKEKDQFLEYWNNEESTIIPIWEDLERHPMNNGLSFLYVQFRNLDFILPFNHNDCEKLEIDLSTSNQEKWIWNKKGFLQTDIKVSNLKDVQTALFFEQNKLYDIQSKLEVLTNFYYRLGMRDGLGKSIPIMKWGEVLRGILDEWNLNDTIKWVDDTMIPILSDVERLGIRVDREKFFDRWPTHQKSLLLENTFTEYNPYTITSRPSNRHLGINYGALNKKDGSRDVFVPRKGKLFLQFDYDAYHVRIIGKLIKYKLPDTSVHQWLADQYGCDYDESKGRTFRILYGGVSEEDRKIPFFDEVDKFIRKMQMEAVRNGYLQTPKGRKIPLGWIEQPNSQKFFNYILQATETEFNIEVLNKLKEKGLPLPILYTYDSFLFEFDDSEVETIKKIKSVLESYGFPVKADWGKNYGEV
jgi:DNA polymerase I-like protein with 3'-5' exonuclease and polymerase domains